MSSYEYGPHGLVQPHRPAHSELKPDDAAVQRQAKFRGACDLAARCKLILRRYSIHQAGYRALAPIFAYLGWAAEASVTPSDGERDALEELLLLIYRAGQTMHTPTEIIAGLFSLFCDSAAVGQTWIGGKLVSLGGDHAMRAAIAGQAFGEREVYFLLAIAIRDRLVAGAFIRGADMSFRLTHAKRAAIAEHLQQP